MSIARSFIRSNNDISRDLYSGSSMMPEEREDYLKFFTGSGSVDMLPYVYKNPSSAYDEMVQNCQDYYLCKDEIETIAQSSDAFARHLDGIVNFIEIGPGSGYPVEHKTLPILNCAKDLESYCAVDYSTSYIENTLSFLKNHPEVRTGVKFYGIEADLMNGEMNASQFASGRKCIMFLGSTIGNFTPLQRSHVIKQTANLTSPGDIFLLTADANQDMKSALQAYTNPFSYRFFSDVLRYFASLNKSFEEHVASFDVRCELSGSTVNIHIIPKKDVSFMFDGYGMITVSGGQKLKCAISHKFSVEEINNLMKPHRFEVVEALNCSGRMTIFVCRRT